MNIYSSPSGCRNFLSGIVCLLTFGICASPSPAGDIQSLETSVGSPIEVFPVIRHIDAKDGITILTAPSESAQILKQIPEASTVNAKARTVREGRAYYLSDWSWSRFIEASIPPNWVAIEGEVASVTAERVISDESSPLVTLRYVTLKGHALPLLLNRDPALNTFLGSKANPIVIENDALNALEAIAKQYPTELRPGYYYSDASYTKSAEASKTKVQISGTFEGFYYLLLPNEYYPDAHIADIGKLTENARLVFWSSEYNGLNSEQSLYSGLSNGIIGSDCVGFGGFVTPEIFLDYLRADQYSKEALPFYEDLTKNPLPPDFFSLSITFDECGGGWHVSIQPRKLSLNVLVLENVSSRTLQLGNFVAKTSPGVAISASIDVAGMASKLMQESSPISLAPAGQVIIPMNMTFPAKTRDQDPFNWLEDSEHFSTIRPDRSKLESVLRPLTRIGFASSIFSQEGEAKIDFHLSKEQFIERCFKPVRGSGKDYYFGPVILPDSAQIDGREYSLARFEPDSVLVSANYEEGSCPTIYAVDRWQQRNRAGHFLTGRDSVEREGFYRLPLPEFGGTLEIVEEDFETSYFKWLRVRYRDNEGNNQYALPDHSVLKPGNPDHLDFDRGDRLRVQFPDFDPDNAPDEIWLEGVGYYVPYPGVPSGRWAR